VTRERWWKLLTGAQEIRKRWCPGLPVLGDPGDYSDMKEYQLVEKLHDPKGEFYVRGLPSAPTMSEFFSWGAYKSFWGS